MLVFLFIVQYKTLAIIVSKLIMGKRMNQIEMYKIMYQKPKVSLLQEAGLGVAEIAARTCYDSFENSENDCIKDAMQALKTEAINAIEGS
jgi:thymidylate synthase (FAD)